MKFVLLILPAALISSLPAALPPSTATQPPDNRLIDYPGFLADAAAVGKLRQRSRVTEPQFLQMASEPDTIILDARSDDKYEMLHIAGARHLALTDVTEGTLARVIPSKSTRILIYCNNNFLDEPVTLASKCARASLNIYTFNTLYSYGYRNVYELAPLASIHTSRLPFAGTMAEKLKEPAKAETWSPVRLFGQ